MAFFVNTRGELVEGQPLNEEEKLIFEELPTVMGNATTGYVSSSDRNLIAKALIQRYELRTRVMATSEEALQVADSPEETGNEVAEVALA